MSPTAVTANSVTAPAKQGAGWDCWFAARGDKPESADKNGQWVKFGSATLTSVCERPRDDGKPCNGLSPVTHFIMRDDSSVWLRGQCQRYTVAVCTGYESGQLAVKNCFLTASECETRRKENGREGSPMTPCLLTY